MHSHSFSLSEFSNYICCQLFLSCVYILPLIYTLLFVWVNNLKQNMQNYQMPKYHHNLDKYPKAGHCIEEKMSYSVNFSGCLVTELFLPTVSWSQQSSILTSLAWQIQLLSLSHKEFEHLAKWYKVFIAFIQEDYIKGTMSHHNVKRKGVQHLRLSIIDF